MIFRLQPDSDMVGENRRYDCAAVCGRVGEVGGVDGRGGYKNRTSPGSLGTGGRTILEKGGYLLSHVRSTIGVAKLNFSVRNGKRWNLRAITT